MDIDILGISEMKWLGSGHFRSANNTVMYWGHSDVLGAQRCTGGTVMYWGHSDVLGAQRCTGGTRPTERMAWE
jgi:hypothetical protein